MATNFMDVFDDMRVGRISCDILTGPNMKLFYCRWVDTTKGPITSIQAPNYDSLIQRVNPEVTSMFFYKGTLPTIPRELANFFPNLNSIHIESCGLNTISKEDLKVFPKLESLKVIENDLKFLPGDLFEFTPKIRKVSFKDNQIHQIGEKVFDKCENLMEVDLRGNKNIDFKFNGEEEDLEKLKLMIANNCKPLKGLRTIAAEVLMNNLNKFDEEKLKEMHFVAKQLKINKLQTKVEYFQKIIEILKEIEDEKL